MTRLLAWLVVLAVAPGAAGGPPNILVVLSDDHSGAHLGCAGDPDVRTPHLDKLAAAGVWFDRAYVACPQCVPSRAAIMTGRSPVAIQMTRFSAPLPADVVTFPELLRAKGYFAGLAGRGFHLDGSRNPPESEAVFEKLKLRTFPGRLDFVRVGAGRGQPLEQFREFLGAVPAGKPWVLQLGFSDPHRPLDCAAFDPPHDPAKLTLPAHYPDTPLVRADYARYLDEIARLDADVGAVLAELDARKLAASTLVVFMGDNGASQLRGKGTLYEFGVRVPLVVRWPGVVAPGRVADDLVSGEDIAPTLLEAAGVAVPAAMTGKSFVKRLRGEAFEGRKYAFSERGAHGGALPTNSSNFDLGRCVVSRRHKLVYNALWQLPYAPVDFGADEFWKDLRKRHDAGTLPDTFGKLYFAPSRPMFELFDLSADPAELVNLAGTPAAAGVEQELKAALQEWMIRERDFLPLPVPPAPAKKPK